MSVNLDTGLLTLSNPLSPSIGLVTLGTGVLTLTGSAILGPARGIILLDTGVINATPIDIAFREMSTCEFKNIVGNLILDGTAGVTPVWAASDFINIVNALRAGNAQPVVSYSADDSMSVLLHALDYNNPAPWAVPEVGSWCADETFPDPIPFVDDLIVHICNGDYYSTLGPPLMPIGTILHSVDLGNNYSRTTPDNVGISMTNSPYFMKYIGEGYILLSANVSGSNTSIIRGRSWGMYWDTIYLNDLVPLSNAVSACDDCGSGRILLGFRPFTSPTYSVVLVESLNYATSFSIKYTFPYPYITGIKSVGTHVVVVCCGIYADQAAFYYSNDSGVTFTLATFPTLNTTSGSGITYVPLLYLGNGVFIFPDSANATSTILRSDDYGVTWSRVTLSPAHGGNSVVRGLGFTNGKGMFTNNSYTWFTEDYGLTFTRTAFIPLAYTDCGNGVVLSFTQGYNGLMYIFRSDDYGETWTAIEEGLLGFPNGRIPYGISTFIDY